MDKTSEDYWNEVASISQESARDAILCGFNNELAFDQAGKIDAGHLVLPFISSSDTVAEVGCGIGRLLKWVAPCCKQAIGLDVSPVMLRLARQRLRHSSNVTFKKIPLSLKIPLKDGSANFIYFYHVSEHLEREDTFAVLREIKRCLRRSGSALVQFSLIKHPDNREAFKAWVGVKKNASVRSRFYTEEEISTILDMVGLHPQIRLFIPGEMVLVVTPSDSRVLGEMPKVQLYLENRAR